MYHSLDAPSRTSPFARAIAKITRGGKVDIVGPYLSVKRLLEVTSRASSWRLVTDVQEWLRAEGYEAQRAADFIEAHHERVQDCRGVHAKVVIGTEEALVGSANLTNAGLGRRTEMAVLIDTAATITELAAWFEALWKSSAFVDVSAARALANALGGAQARAASDELNAVIERVQLPAAGPCVRADPTIDESSTALAVLGPLDHTTLVRIGKRLRRLGSTREQIETTLDVLREAVVASQLGPEDPRLFVNISASDPHYIASVTVGNKYVASAGFLGKTPMIALTMSKASVERPDIARLALRVGEGFAHRDGLYLVRLPPSAIRSLPDEVIEDWHACIRDEATRSESSPYRTRWGFRPEAYAVMMFTEIREQVLMLIPTR